MWINDFQGNLWSLGIAYRDATGTTLGLTYDFRTRIVAGGARVSESMLFISHPLEPRLKLQIYFMKGFSDTSPHAGLGAMLAHSL